MVSPDLRLMLRPAFPLTVLAILCRSFAFRHDHFAALRRASRLAAGRSLLTRAALVSLALGGVLARLLADLRLAHDHEQRRRLYSRPAGQTQQRRAADRHWRHADADGDADRRSRQRGVRSRHRDAADRTTRRRSAPRSISCATASPAMSSAAPDAHAVQIPLAAGGQVPGLEMTLSGRGRRDKRNAHRSTHGSSPRARTCIRRRSSRAKPLPQEQVDQFFSSFQLY